MSKSKAYYLDETEQLKKLSKDETEDLLTAYFSGEVSVMDQLVEGNMYLVKEVVDSMDLSDEVYMDAVQEGNMALFSAFLGMEDTEDLLPRLKAAIYTAITAYCEEEEQSVRPGEELAAQLNVLDRVCQELAEEYGREATASEVADMMQLDEDTVRYLMQIALAAISKD